MPSFDQINFEEHCRSSIELRAIRIKSISTKLLLVSCKKLLYEEMSLYTNLKITSYILVLFELSRDLTEDEKRKQKN